jgi:hypothetical protein
VKLLVLILHAAPVFVPRVVGRVASTSTTRLGTIDDVASTKRRTTKRRGLRVSRSDVRQRQDVPDTQNAPVEVKVQVTMPTTHDITARVAMTTTTADVLTPAGIGCGMQEDEGVVVAGSRGWPCTGGVAAGGVGPGMRNGSRRMPV